jgi:hypothetical protein
MNGQFCVVTTERVHGGRFIVRADEKLDCVPRIGSGDLQNSIDIACRPSTELRSR